jgi:hypothetical protein
VGEELINVHIREQLVSEALDVFVVRQCDSERYLLHTENSSVFRWDEVPTGAAVSDVILEPTFVLPFDSGRVLLEALTRHYQGAEDTRQLRKDYDAERKRSDGLINALVDIARASAERGFRS